MVHSDFCPPLYTNGRQHHTNGRQHHTYHYPLYPFYPWVQTMGMGMGMALTHIHKLPMKIDGYGYGYGYYPITHTQAELYFGLPRNLPLPDPRAATNVWMEHPVSPQRRWALPQG